MAKRFVEHFDRDLQAVVTSEKHRQELMKKKGVEDTRDCTSIDTIRKIRDRNRKDQVAKENQYLDDPIKRALLQAENGEDFMPELTAKLEEESQKEQDRQENQAQLNREREQEAVERWHHDHGGRR